MTRRNKIIKASENPERISYENKRLLIKKGPVSEETSLKELEENYVGKPEWKVIEGGGVLSVPVEEFRMINLPKPDRAGNVKFVKRTGKDADKLIEGYHVAQTIARLNEEIVKRYKEEMEKAKDSGTSESGVQNIIKKLPECTAVQQWLDVKAEIKLKGALVKLMKGRNIPTLIIRSIDQKQVSVLAELGLKILSRSGEIDLAMAYASGDMLNVVIFEVKRANTYLGLQMMPVQAKRQ